MFVIKMETGNAAFGDYPNDEVGRILGHVVACLEDGDLSGSCYDINGNKVGEWRLDYE